jgi:hypothetical protein
VGCVGIVSTGGAGRTDGFCAAAGTEQSKKDATKNCLQLQTGIVILLYARLDSAT